MVAPKLQTKRLLLRQWKNEDLSLFAEMNSDKRVMKYFPSLLSKQESEEFAQNIQVELREKQYGLWAIELKEHTSFIGFVGLHYQDFLAHFTPCIEIGWRLAYEFWRKGYAFEAASKVIDYAFQSLHLKEIVSFTARTNQPSRNLMEKLGMRRNAADDFYHTKIPKDHPLSLHVLYKLQNPKKPS